MIDGIFELIMGAIGSILSFIIVAGIVGFILILPFLLNGGWILGILIYGFIFGMIAIMISEKCKKDDEGEE